LLVALGFSGAWIGNLTVLEPYRPIFIGAALVALYFAWSAFSVRCKRANQAKSARSPGASCLQDHLLVVAVLVLIALAFPYVLPLFY